MSDNQLDITNPEHLKIILEKLNKNDEILEARINRSFQPLFTKIADLEYQIELFARMNELQFIKEADTTKEYVKKVTLQEYKDMAKRCKNDLDMAVAEFNQSKD